MRSVDKVVAYVVREGELLVFRHRDVPEAGLQVPAGTVRSGEQPVDAVIRETTEESGLGGLTVVAHLGDRTFDAQPYGKDELHQRSFFHLTTTESTPTTWSHAELHDGLRPPTWFEFSWMPLDRAADELVADQGAMLDRIRMD